VALTRRGKALVAGVVVAVLGGSMAALALSGNAPAPIQEAFSKAGIAPAPIEPCPLTGEPLPGDKQPPARPVLAVKVENSPDSRPQAGLERADIVYEEPVEGGVTRFIALFQCRDSGRIGPVRSARMTDPSVLVQYGSPLLGYAGGVTPVERAIEEAGLIDLSYEIAVDQFTRDESRVAPHNLYTTTKGLYRFAKSKQDRPAQVFAYDSEISGKSRPARRIHLLFSSSFADVYWNWDQAEGAWLRSHGTEPHMLEGGRVGATNIVVMHVKVTDSNIVDVTGAPSPDVEVVGQGKAWVFRNGRMISGRWERPSESDVTRFVTAAGEEIALAPGTTWVELVPSVVPVEVGGKAV
jgi:hypothetical protein